MIKNIIIALLIGIITGQSLSAQNHQTTGLERGDLIEAAALCGMLANTHHDPFGQLGFGKSFRGPEDFIVESKTYRRLMK